MTESRSDREKRIFLRCLDLEPTERDEYLDRECAGAPELRADVERLLAAQVDTAGIPVAPAFDRLEDEAPERVGAYRILEKLGEGGFGLVYRAQQEEPVRREVAVKVLKRGMDTDQVVARFEAERQALARMDHPGISTVFDAGTTPDGRPYFVMELVRGTTVTDYAKQQALGVEQRLSLFLDVCAAVQHAHNKGVIHRDLKPPNILVTEVDGKPVPRVIDFGIAKAVVPDGPEQAALTQAEHFMGTPAYMSPEQAMGAASVDTRSDVYSLGVVLYQLLTGELPFDLDQAASSGRAEVVRVLCEEEPLRPSTRVTATGGAASREAASGLKGDLDWIVLRSLEKSPDRRYATVDALAADLRRHLAFEPVLAGPPGATYRIGKFVRRNRVAVGAGTMVVVGLAVGLAFAMNGLVRASAAAKESKAINEFLVDLIAQADPWESGGDVSLRTAIEQATSRIGVSFREQPRVAAEVRFTMAESYLRLGDVDRALGLLEQSMEELTDHFGDNDPSVLRTRLGIATMHTYNDDLETAGAELMEVHERITRELGPRHQLAAESWGALAEFHSQSGDLDRAEDAYRQALALPRTATEGDIDVLLKGLGWVCLNEGKTDLADSCFTELKNSLDAECGPRHPRTLESRVFLGYVAMDRQQLDEAEETFRSVLPDLIDVLGPDHPLTLAARNSLVQTLVKLDRFDEALEGSREVWQSYARALGDDHQNALITKAEYAELLSEVGRIDESKAMLHEVLETRKARYPRLHPELAITYGKLAIPYLRNGEREEGTRYLEQAIALQREASDGGMTPNLNANLSTAASSYVRLGRYQDALDAIREVHPYDVRDLGEDHPRLAGNIRIMAWSLDGLGRHAEAESLWVECLRLRTLGGENAARMRADDRSRYAMCLLELGRYDEAEDRMEQALMEWSDEEGNAHPDLEQRSAELSERYRSAGLRDRAKAWDRRREAALATPGPGGGA